MSRTKKKEGEPKNCFERIIEDKELPPYWYRKYRYALTRYRRYYGIAGRKKGINPMHEILIEKVAYLSTKMLYYEHPDFYKDTGLKIDNPLYMGKYDNLIKAMVKLMEQLQKYTEAKPASRSEKKVLTLNTTAKEIKELKDADLNAAIRELISGEEGTIKEISSGETITEGTGSG